MTARNDMFDAQSRSRIMRAVRSADTAPERRVRAAVRALRAGYRLGGWGLPGRPDLVFPGRRLVVFVHGCFWHGHDCARGARAPKDNADYWLAKIARNRSRDARVMEELAEAGWRTAVVWECETKEPQALAARLAPLLAQR